MGARALLDNFGSLRQLFSCIGVLKLFVACLGQQQEEKKFYLIVAWTLLAVAGVLGMAPVGELSSC